MITLYSKNETDFTHIGTPVELINPLIELEDNGAYFFTAEAPIITNFEKGQILKIPVKWDNPQLFRIRDITRTSKRISIRADHIFYDLNYNYLEDVRPTNLSLNAALNWILERTSDSHNFTATSDIADLSTMYILKKNVVNAIFLMIEKWGGHLKRDNFNISINSTIGTNKGARIDYGYNLIDIKEQLDWSSVVTKIRPTGGNNLSLPELYIESDISYEIPYTKEISFEITQGEDETILDAQNRLREEAIKYLDIYKYPKVNYSLNAHLDDITGIGDTIFVNHEPLNIQLETKVIKIKYDPILERYKNIEFGNFTKDLSNSFVSLAKSVNDNVAKVNSSFLLSNAAYEATQLLKSAMGGYVVKLENELLIVDNLDLNEAVKVWRWNQNGLGYSETGLNGTYNTAITSDGRINADFIQTGTLSANRIEALNSLILDVKDLDGNFDTLLHNFNGLLNSVSTIGGNNFWRNTFFSEYENGLLTYWDGPLKSIPNFNSASRTAGSLQNGIVKQSVTLKNGTYSNKFKYVKKLSTANASVKYNGKIINLTEDSGTIFSVEEVTTGSMTIEFICDTNDGFQIYELMLNVGDTPITFVQNVNEVITDTVNIGKGVEVISSAIKSKCRIDADGLRGINTDTSEVTFYQTTDGLYGKKLTTESIQSGDLIITTRNRHNFISGL